MTQLNATIRRAQPTDHIAIASLLVQLGYEATPALIQEKIRALLPSPVDCLLVAALEREVIGSISLHALALFHTEGFLGRITSLVVDERYRGRGVGHLLMADAERWFVSVGCVKLEVTSGKHRRDAHRFYEQHGFAQDGLRLARGLPTAPQQPDR